MVESVTIRILVELAMIIGLLSLNGLFALSEIAVVSANRVRLQQLRESNPRVERVLLLAEDPTAFLSTVQIGITLIGILAGALSGATLSTELASILETIPLVSPYAELLSFSVVVVFVTMLSLLIGELIPKSIALSNPERFAIAIAPLMQLLARVTLPIVVLLSFLNDSALRLLRIAPNEQPPVTEDEIKTLLSEGTRAGIFEPLEEQIVTQALELDDISLRPILTHRTQVKWMNVSGRPDEWFKLVKENPYRAFPVCDGAMDRALGVITAREFLVEFALYSQEGKPLDLKELIQPALFVPVTVTPSSLLTHFREAETSMIFAVDEYGGVEGVVTQTDILERLTARSALANSN